MPVDKFGRMSNAKTRDTGVSLNYINNNYIHNDGSTPISGSIDMNGNTLYNVSDPVNPQDVATKEYADNVRGSGWVRRKQDGTYAIKIKQHIFSIQYILTLFFLYIRYFLFLIRLQCISSFPFIL